MRKTLNINLGGLAFIIDENAFEVLHNYLEALKRKFNNEAERNEIMNDIEGRMAEMLNQRLQSRREVISLDDVNFVTNAMGKPEDIAGEETQTTTSATGAAAQAPFQGVKRRLFRDPDDTKVGGVISGLCHYFGINDPTWVRIAILIMLFFTGGTIVFVYFLMMIIVPKAQTAAEKLQMKGEPVNITTIEKEIKDAANRAGESVERFVREQNFFEKLGHGIAEVFTAIGKVIAVFTIVLSLTALVAVVVCFIAFYVTGSSQYNNVTHMLVDSGTLIRTFSIGVLLFFGAPLVASIYLGLKVVLGRRGRVAWLKWGLLGAWIVGIAIITVSFAKGYDNFRSSATHNFENNLTQPANGTLHVLLTDSLGKKLDREWHSTYNDDFNVDAWGHAYLNGTDLNELDRVSLGRPDLQLMPSENDSFYIQRIVTSRGRSRNDADSNTQTIIYNYRQADSVLALPFDYYIQKGAKWRAQNMRISIAIPKVKIIHFADNIDLWNATVKGDANYNDTYFANTTWTVEDGKVKCIEGENHKNAADKKDRSRNKAGGTSKHNNDDDKSDQDF